MARSSTLLRDPASDRNEWLPAGLIRHDKKTGRVLWGTGYVLQASDAAPSEIRWVSLLGGNDFVWHRQHVVPAGSMPGQRRPDASSEGQQHVQWRGGHPGWERESAQHQGRREGVQRAEEEAAVCAPAAEVHVESLRVGEAVLVAWFGTWQPATVAAIGPGIQADVPAVEVHWDGESTISKVPASSISRRRSARVEGLPHGVRSGSYDEVEEAAAMSAPAHGIPVNFVKVGDPVLVAWFGKWHAATVGALKAGIQADIPEVLVNWNCDSTRSVVPVSSILIASLQPP